MRFWGIPSQSAQKARVEGVASILEGRYEETSGSARSTDICCDNMGEALPRCGWEGGGWCIGWGPTQCWPSLTSGGLHSSVALRSSHRGGLHALRTQN